MYARHSSSPKLNFRWKRSADTYAGSYHIFFFMMHMLICWLWLKVNPHGLLHFATERETVYLLREVCSRKLWKINLRSGWASKKQISRWTPNWASSNSPLGDVPGFWLGDPRPRAIILYWCKQPKPRLCCPGELNQLDATVQCLSWLCWQRNLV